MRFLYKIYKILRMGKSFDSVIKENIICGVLFVMLILLNIIKIICV